MNKKVAVIIINYKTSHLMQALIDSIIERDIDVSILIVDNASTPETYNELLLIKDLRVKLLRCERNLGFTGGINYALKYVTENSPYTSHFFLLNPDAFSCQNLIGGLMEILEKNPDAASVSPKIVFMNGDPWYSGANINFTLGKVINIGIKESEVEKKYYEVDVFSGCAALFDRTKVMHAGMFNEDLFMYYDEADFSIKLKSLGYKNLYTPHYKIYHDVSYTTKNISHLKTYYMTRNKFFVFGKQMNLYSKVYFLAHEFAFHIKNLRFRNAYYHLRGFFDFLKKKKGAFSA